MSIELIHLGTGGKMVAIEGEASWKHFQQLIQNGSGLYPDLPAEIKGFADEVTVGKILQPYKDDPAMVRCSTCGKRKPIEVIVYKGTTPECLPCRLASDHPELL